MQEPFDARRAWLIDRSKRPSQWATTSLVVALRHALAGDGSQPGDVTSEGRPDLARRAVDELTERGIDGDSLVRYGLFPEVLSGILAQIMPALFSEIGLDVGGVADELSRTGDDGAAGDWLTVLRPTFPDADPTDLDDVPGKARFIRGWIESVARSTLPWVFSANLDDLLSLRPPTMLPDDWIAPDHELVNQYRWLVERFSLTHVADWSTSSLHLEYRWMAGRCAGACADELMADRSVAARELDAEIARRAAAPSLLDGTPMHPGLEYTLSARMQSQAVTLLEDGQFIAAATLFEFALSETPDDANAANNLGFCLLPIDPRRALKHLEHAQSLNYHDPAVNSYNRALCHHRLGNHRKAVEIAEACWPTASSTATAVLWTISGEQLALCEQATVRRELAVLAGYSAAALGESSIESLWQDRAA